MSNLILPRRSFLAGLGALVAAPAIVRAESLMPIKTLEIIAPPKARIFRIVQTMRSLDQWVEVTASEVMDAPRGHDVRQRVKFNALFFPYEVGDLVSVEM